MDENEDRFDAVLPVPSDRKIKENFDRDVKLDLSDQQKEYEYKMFPVNIVFNSNALMKWQSGYMMYYTGQAEALKLPEDFQSEVINTIVSYHIGQDHSTRSRM